METTPRKPAKREHEHVALTAGKAIARFALLAAAVSGAARPQQTLEPPPPVPREFRAAWVTPIWDRGFRDWPSASGLSPDSQRAELRAMLDHASAIGLNVLILHVRLAGDAIGGRRDAVQLKATPNRSMR